MSGEGKGAIAFPDIAPPGFRAHRSTRIAVRGAAERCWARPMRRSHSAPGGRRGRMPARKVDGRLPSCSRRPRWAIRRGHRSRTREKTHRLKRQLRSRTGYGGRDRRKCSGPSAHAGFNMQQTRNVGRSIAGDGERIRCGLDIESGRKPNRIPAGRDVAFVGDARRINAGRPCSRGPPPPASTGKPALRAADEASDATEPWARREPRPARAQVGFIKGDWRAALPPGRNSSVDEVTQLGFAGAARISRAEKNRRPSSRPGYQGQFFGGGSAPRLSAKAAGSGERVLAIWPADGGSPHQFGSGEARDRDATWAAPWCSVVFGQSLLRKCPGAFQDRGRLTANRLIRGLRSSSNPDFVKGFADSVRHRAFRARKRGPEARFRGAPSAEGFRASANPSSTWPVAGPIGRGPWDMIVMPKGGRG